MSTPGVIAAGHTRTAHAAEQVLRAGGNAFDAILAAACAACAAEPELCSLGGGGYLLARPAAGPARIYDFFVHTPRSKRPEGEIDFCHVVADFGTARQNFHIGLGAIATPGMIRGLFEIHTELGYMPIRDVVAPAVHEAREGVTIDALHAYIFRVVGPICMHTAETRAIYGSPENRDRLLVEGEVLRQPELAETLEILAIEGADLFYSGEMGRRLVDQCAEGGGYLVAEDLERYTVERRAPLAQDYRGVRVLTNPPPSAGGTLIALALRLLEAVELQRFAYGTRAHLDLIAQTLERTNRARLEARIAAERSGAQRPDPLDEALVARYRDEICARAVRYRGTTHMSAIDDAGNVASLTLSNGEGCGHIIRGTGIMPNNMLGEEDLVPDGPHCWPVDRRMGSMMSPTVLQFADGRVVATGSGGSKRIRSAILQVVVNLVDHRMHVEQAVESPRVFSENGHLSVEGGFRHDEVERLLEDYPEHQVWDQLNLFFGGAHTVEATRGAFHGAGDPRRGGACIVVD